jgi:hypothetical protein
MNMNMNTPFRSTCAICLSKVKHNSHFKNKKHFYTTLRCGHSFHEICIRNWYGKKMTNTTCPMCRLYVGKELKTELRNRANEVMRLLTLLHHNTIHITQYLMHSNSQTAVFFRTEQLPISNNNLAPFNTTPNYNSEKYYEKIWIPVVHWVLFERISRDDTNEIRKYLDVFYKLLNTYILFLKMLSDTFGTIRNTSGQKKSISLPIGDNRRDMMKNRYLHTIYDILRPCLETHYPTGNTKLQKCRKMFYTHVYNKNYFNQYYFKFD